MLTGGTGISEYIAGVQLGREQIRAKNKETLMQIINSDQISEEEKQTAIQNLIGMTEISEKGERGGDAFKGKRLCGPGGQHHGREGGRRGERGIALGSRAGADRGYREEEDGDRGGRIVITLLDVDE